MNSSGTNIGLENVLAFIETFSFSSGTTILSEADEVYTGITTVGGSGSGASFTVTRNSSGAISSVQKIAGGSGYQISNQFTISGSLIGGGGNIDGITGSGTTVGAAATYSGLTGTTSGSGVGAEFTIERNGDGNITLFDIEESGIKYKVGDTITILGSNVGGVNGTDNVTLTVTDIIDQDAIQITVTDISQPTILTVGSIFDWYNQQTLGLTNSTIFWRSIADKPRTTDYSLQRSGRNDALHIAIIDDDGKVSGIQGNILEKHLSLSKSRDAVSSVDSPIKIWYKDYLAQYSSYIYAGDNPSDNENNEQVFQTGFSELFTPYTMAEGLWNDISQDKTFSAIGNAMYVLTGGKDYGDENAEPGETGTMTAQLGPLLNSYDVFLNREEIAIDYLIMGPGLGNKFESQAKAAHLIALAEQRKDCVAVISPHRLDVVSEADPSTGLKQYLTTDQITDNIIEFFSPLSSSSYAIFDSGYKYTYDRFNNKFRYIPCNPDVAGLCVRTSIFAYPWFSPAGQQRGILNNAIKLAYSPNKFQRDQLYPQRVNAVITKPGLGTLLFGDKTALGYASAFDRINVRRLFLTVEQALERTAEAQLFELNDEITRANFVNIVEPYLRDVQAKRGLYGFFVSCDESNNTPDVIDNNEFRADIFLKPAKSINYVTLTFVATRTGVAFEEVVGTV